MQIQARKIRSRAEEPRRAPNLSLVKHGVVHPTREEVAKFGRPIFAGDDGCGCGDPMEAARRAAWNCGVPGGGNGFANNAGPNAPGNAMAGITPDNCSRYGLRYVPIGVQQTAALAANDPISLSISPQAPFLPYLWAISPAASAPSVRITQIAYGTVNELIGGVVNGELFAVTNQIGGYRLPSKFWITPGMTLTVTGTAVAAIAAGVLFVQCYGFTNAPG